jgi:AraC-like DNA-binding protein/mannose-6-phosphate isomerase-like protein (cupin superfamily)
MQELPIISKSIYKFDNRFFQEDKRYGSIRILQIGDIQCQEGSVVSEHVQPCFEITYVVSGKGKCIIDGEEISLREGKIIVILKNEKHGIISDDEKPLRYFFLSFELLISHPLFNQFKLLQQKIKKDSDRIQNDCFNMQDIFIRCLSEFVNPNEYSNIIIESCLNQIICYVFHIYNLQDYMYRPNFENHEVMVYKIINYIEENIMKIYTVDDIAGHFHYSVSHISHLFTKHLHKTPGYYIKDCKFKKALNFLEDPKCTPTEIAEILGYASIHSFSRAFKSRFKVSPTKWSAVHTENQ